MNRLIPFRNQPDKRAQEENIYLTELQAWRVAEVIFRRRDGFCRMIEMLKDSLLITDRVSKQMLKRFEHLPDDSHTANGYKFPKTCGCEHDLLRVIFATDRADMLSRRRKRNNK